MACIADLFCCPVCASDRIEEVLINAVMMSEVLEIDSNGCKTYGDSEASSGEVEGYRCACCSEPIDLDDLPNMPGK